MAGVTTLAFSTLYKRACPASTILLAPEQQRFTRAPIFHIFFHSCGKLGRQTNDIGAPRVEADLAEKCHSSTPGRLSDP